MTRLPRIAARIAGAFLLILASTGVDASTRPSPPRRVIPLDGPWQVAEGGLDRAPAAFDHTIVVPGLIDMARPAFPEVGRKSRRRRAFWYRRTFRVDGPPTEVAWLKVNKARYGTRVWLNGRDVGEHLPCFTPGYLDVKPFMKAGGAENELIIRVGADRESIPADVPSGWDFEKYLYIPGIYDSVELILTGTPFIRNVQVVPDVATQTVRAVVELESGPRVVEARLTAAVHEAASGRAVGPGDAASLPLAAGTIGTTEVGLSLPGARLWSPEDPFLYELSLSTGETGDAIRVRFGLRSFRFDPVSRRALLNGRPYYLCGTNVCIFRFFEDAQRGDRPWRAEWVRRLHRRFKAMDWNTIRYCIGFPPESWYDIADEEGFLIQDEFPIWLLTPGRSNESAPESPRAGRIIPQYIEWMRERWNHPCVVIWDGQNESVTEETGKAIRAVRHLDLSRRPWDNGWGEPQGPTDCVESHTYFFIRDWNGQGRFRLSELAGMSGVPQLLERQKRFPVPVILNEYAWLWLTRDGHPTSLTGPVYEHLLGPRATPEQRQRLYARYLAAETEFWRCHRQCAGVLQFCGLGYSRPGDQPRPEGGATSDRWIDPESLTWEPNFERYVRDAFSPVGLMLDFWAGELPAGAERPFSVVVINDLEREWQGDVRLSVLQGEKDLSTRSATARVPGLGRTTLAIPQSIPAAPGDYTLMAELTGASGRPVRSVRDLKVIPVTPGPSREGRQGSE
jgi:beta-galactosidase